MPEQAGIETIREIRQFQPDLHIIAMSGSAVSVQMARHLGADEGLVKPFSREQLLTAVQRLPPTNTEKASNSISRQTRMPNSNRDMTIVGWSLIAVAAIGLIWLAMSERFSP